jgi:hypothetical protein
MKPVLHQYELPQRSNTRPAPVQPHPAANFQQAPRPKPVKPARKPDGAVARPKPR